MRLVFTATAVLALTAGLGVPGAPVRAETPTIAVEPAGSCDDATARSVAETVQSRYDDMPGLAADFDQWTESVVLSTGAIDLADDAAARSRGHVIFRKPGKMRWEYREPEESYVISDGEILWIYDVAGKQATRVTVGEEYLTGAALQFLLGEGKLIETFVIALGRCSPGFVELELQPRKPSSYERLSMTADPASGLITETSIVDLFGNRTRIRFENIVVGETPPSGSFHFVRPPGVEVVDLAAP